MTGLSSGQQAFVSSTNRLYVSNGSGWYNTALISADPNGSSPLTEYTIVDSSPLDIIAKATDSDNSNLLNQSVASDSAQYMVDITNRFFSITFTPRVLIL